jgi:hypothetical protein
MFTTFKSLLAILGMTLVVESMAFAEEPGPLPKPPLQPMPKEFKVPRPNLGVPEGIPVAQESAPRRSVPTDPKPDPNRDAPRTVPQPPSVPPAVVIGAQAAQEGLAVLKNVRAVGKIFRVDGDRVVVETIGGGELVLHVDPKTEYLRRNAETGYAALIPGAQFSAVYEQRGERLWITAIDVLSPDEVRPVRPAVVVPAAASPYETEIVRIVGPDQIVVRNGAGVEFPIYMTDQTRFLVGDAAAAFGDLRTGMRIRIEDEIRAERRLARRIVGLNP